MAIERYICLGDSLTHGYGVMAGEGWVERLSTSQVLGTARIENQGVDGNTLQAMLNRLEMMRLDSSDCVIILGGTNDILMGRQADYCLHKLQELVTVAQNQGAGLVLGLLPPIDFDSFNQNPIVDDYNHRIVAYAREKGFPVIDFHKPLKEAASSGILVYTGDVHPNALGYTMMFQAAKKVLVR